MDGTNELKLIETNWNEFIWNYGEQYNYKPKPKPKPKYKPKPNPNTQIYIRPRPEPKPKDQNIFGSVPKWDLNLNKKFY